MRAFLREALFGEERLLQARRTRFVLLAAALSFAAIESYLALARHETFHGHTFDLAFYARMAWGAAHLDGWNPIANASVFGLHLVWIDYLLGPLGVLLGTVPVLLVTQALALGLAALPLARIGARHLGPYGALAGGAALLLHPNLSHVAAGDFHPGSVAVLPLAWLMDALDRRSWRGVVLASVGVLLCREDLGLVTMIAALVLVRRGRADRVVVRAGLALAAGSFLYVALFSLVLLPLLGPPAGSLDAHFGHWGGGVASVVVYLLGHPGELLTHLATPERLLYLPTIVAPLAFLSFLAPELLLVAAPALAICLLSRFPTTLFLDSHYLTPALPMLVAAAIVGAARVRTWVEAPWAAIALAALVAHVVGGADPLSLRFDPRAYRSDVDTAALRDIVDIVGPTASVQAPDRVLAHFAERVDVRRSPPPETHADYVLLDASHRTRFLHDEDVLRADEEPLVRTWLAREDHALVGAGTSFLLLRHGDDPRASPIFGARVTPYADRPEVALPASSPLTACLGLASARIEGATSATLILTLRAFEACPSDLALRIGVGFRPRRVDFIADGLVSPAHFRDRDVIESRHPLTPAEEIAILERGLRVGAVRESGARPSREDPVALDVVVSR